jgi:hypothetical protein
MPMWDDFDSESGNVYTDTRGTTPTRQFIVEWFDRVHFSGSSNTDGATFELILNEDGTIQFEYSDVEFTGGLEAPDCSGGSCATIGLQNDQSLFNQFSAFQNSVTDNSGVKWTATSPTVFTGTDTATVNVGAPAIVVSPSPITGSVPAGGTSTIPFAIENTGNRDLNWSLTEAGPADLHFPPPGSRYAPQLGDPAKVSNRPAPLALRHQGTKAAQQLPHAPLGVAVAPTFAADILQNIFETFDAANPAVTATVAATDGTAWTGGAFVDGDFSKLFVISGSFAANPDTFATIDTTTGAVTVIGNPNSGGAGWNGLAYDPSTGTMYAVTGCPSGSSLYTIDQGTGAPTLVGALPNEACTVAIAFDPDGNLFGLDIVSDGLFAIDKTNASDSLIGSIGFNANYAQDMAFDEATGILYLAGFNLDVGGQFMYTVDTTSGLATLIGAIGSAFGEVDAMGIETAGGPCSAPLDLPWLSLAPLTGTTPPAGSTPVTASIDGAGTTDGDVLSGTVCAASNDPNNHTLATPITVTVGGGGGGGIVDSGPIDLAINADFTGLYINWLTGDFCSSDTNGGSLCFGLGAYDFNPWDLGGLAFSYPSTSLCAASNGSDCDVLASGAVIGPASTFTTGSSTNYVSTSSTGYLGFSVDCPAGTCYGYASLTSTSGTGFPATLNEYWYDSTGVAITIP